MKSILSSLLAGLALASLAASAAPKVTTAAGAAPADITAAVAAFRAEIGLGGAGNTTNGPFADGFRNINWDGTAEAAAAPNAMPADFFNNNVRRGAVFTSPAPGTGVQVSAATGNSTGTAVRFGHLDASYATRFRAFTEQRLFAAIGSTIIDTAFFVPGTPEARATVNGFGVVFCDVDLANISGFECFDAEGKSLGKFFAPAADNGLSFLGVFFQDGERVARVRITHGNLPLAAGNVDTATLDVVATDDFMFGEPLPLAPNAKLINVANRARAGIGDDVAITGFVVGGTQPKTVLIRAVGPSLAPVVPAATRPALLANPQLTIFNAAGQSVATNNDWGNRPELAQAAALVGALPLTAGSLDAALLAVLAPGAYTVVVSGAGGTSGLVLTEVFEAK
jgi:hypothetical protein